MAGGVKIGTTFRSIYADGNPLWRVDKPRGRRTWECVVEGGEDFAGTRKVFGTEEIASALAQTEMWRTIGDENEAWWSAQPIGTVVHYSNGFGQFVRGVVVEDDGTKKMRPTALIGNWQKHDLPHLTAAGNLREGHYSVMVRQGGVFRPNFSNMVESAGTRGYPDPRGQDAIDLTPPTPSEEHLEAHRLNEIAKLVKQHLSAEGTNLARPLSEELRAGLIAARDLLNAARL